MKEVLDEIVRAVKKAVAHLVWKIHLFSACVKMDIKNFILRQRIKKTWHNVYKEQTRLNQLRGGKR